MVLKQLYLQTFAMLFLEARKHIKLSKRQEVIANQCEILIRAFAKVGIIALVDEATGYQYDKKDMSYKKFLKHIFLKSC